ncbi:hypothetical protein [Nostoc piscinale]|nr:hypothetical protein [Nostoc piscinale]
MTNSQKITLQSSPPPSQNNPVLDNLVALQRKMSEFIKDFAEIRR